MEHWSLLDSVYFCVTTVATVGYGDLTPTRDASKLFTSFFAVLGVVIIGSALAHVVMEFFEGENIVVMKCAALRPPLFSRLPAFMLRQILGFRTLPRVAQATAAATYNALWHRRFNTPPSPQSVEVLAEGYSSVGHLTQTKGC
jgi:hypothetical protein